MRDSESTQVSTVIKIYVVLSALFESKKQCKKYLLELVYLPPGLAKGNISSPPLEDIVLSDFPLKIFKIRLLVRGFHIVIRNDLS